MKTTILRAILMGGVFALAVPVAGHTQSVGGPAASARSAGGHSVAVPSVTAVRRRTAIVLDAKLDDDAWKDAQVVTDFTQVDPDQGKPGSQRTEMRILYDDDALYIGARMFDTEGRAGVRTSLVRRDQQFNSDYIEIVIDGFHDHLGRAFFDLNPSGSRQDQLGMGTSCCDSGWDPVWDAATSIDDDGWSAEIRIPLSQLRFSKDPVQTWGLQLRRFIQRRNEYTQWAYWAKNEPGGPQRFGHLTGLEFKKAQTKHLELLPYAVAKTKNVAFTPGDPFNDGSVQSSRVGLDLRYLLSSNLTLDATFNPDFGQVEVDPAVVNLSAFETSFPEKRPFFIANSGVFNYGGFNCYFCSNVSSLSAFYSRRIGRSPTGADIAYGKGPYVDMPDASEILGAAKITGRTSNGWTVGVLNAVTGKANAHVQTATGTRFDQEVEPLTNYFVGRVKKDLQGGNLVVGGIATSVLRKMDDTFAPRLNSHSEFVGGDWLYTWANRQFSWRGNLGLSSISGDRRAILARQLSSARYFQRPDRGAGSSGLFSNRLDTTATSMQGGAAYMRVAKDAGNWLWESAINVRTPGFENNDMAFLTRADYVWYNANVVRNWTTPTKWYRDLNMTAGGQQQRNWSGDLTDRQLQYYVGATLPNFWNANTFYVWRPELADDRLLRGGPVVNRPGTTYVSVDLNSDSRRSVIWSASADYSTNTRGGWGTNQGASVQYRPSTAVSVSFGPSWSNSHSLLQYVTAASDPTATAFSGKRYVMSAIQQSSLALDTRLSITFRPTMTLELYAQPFLASGDYFDFKEFDAPRQGNFTVYGKGRGTIAATKDATGLVTKYTVDPDGTGPAAPFSFGNPNFNFRSLRGNAVFRWEYRPGSTLFVAWTHARADQQPLGDFNFSRDEQGLLATRPDNILLVKASWWFVR
jgi:hypothetical protein